MSEVEKNCIFFSFKNGHCLNLYDMNREIFNQIKEKCLTIMNTLLLMMTHLLIKEKFVIFVLLVMKKIKVKNEKNNNTR